MAKIKLVVDTPYTLEIGTNDSSIGKCEGDLFLSVDKYNIALPVVHVSGIKYKINIPSTVSELGDNVKYKLYMYTHNSRFLVDSGKADIISKETFEPIAPDTKKDKDVKKDVKEKVVIEDSIITDDPTEIIVENILPTLKKSPFFDDVEQMKKNSRDYAIKQKQVMLEKQQERKKVNAEKQKADEIIDIKRQKNINIQKALNEALNGK